MISVILALLVAAQSATAPDKSNTTDKVEIVLYSDFQCPYCAQFAPAIRQIEAKGIDGIKTTVRFKNFPLSIHPNAQLAHQAAMAAKEQGKFWEMHDLLFANQSRVQRVDLLGYAKKLGLNVTRFERDLDSPRIKQSIAADMAEANKLGVSGTPTYTISGKVYSGTKPFEQLKELIGGEQRRARALAEISEDLMSRGSVEAPVTLEVFADLESPVSRPAMLVIDDVLRQYPSKVRLQFRNFPLAFHPQATLAHDAAMTAAKQGKFWEFASYVLEHQGSLREQDLITYAGALGLDSESFAKALQEHRYSARVDADVQAGVKRGIRGSPVVFVNGKRIDGVPSVKMLTDYVEAELAARAGTQAKKN